MNIPNQPDSGGVRTDGHRRVLLPWWPRACRGRALLGWIICCTVLCGCGPSGPQRVPVRGKVTFDGAPPPGLGTVYFATIKAAEGFPRRPGHGNFKKGDGSFVVTSVKPGDGLVPGTYRVMIECWQRLPDDSGNPGVSYARSDFNPPELEIKVGTRGPIELQYDVPRAP